MCFNFDYRPQSMFLMFCQSSIMVDRLPNSNEPNITKINLSLLRQHNPHIIKSPTRLKWTELHTNKEQYLIKCQNVITLMPTIKTEFESTTVELHAASCVFRRHMNWFVLIRSSNNTSSLLAFAKPLHANSTSLTQKQGATSECPSTPFTCVGVLWRTRNITIVAILIQWDANKWTGILKFRQKQCTFSWTGRKIFPSWRAYNCAFGHHQEKGRAPSQMITW